MKESELLIKMGSMSRDNNREGFFTGLFEAFVRTLNEEDLECLKSATKEERIKFIYNHPFMREHLEVRVRHTKII